MATISETEFEKICEGIRADRDVIIKNNPIGTDAEILLWLLFGVLVSFLDLGEIETPCFTGIPDEKTYRDAIHFVLKGRMKPEFDPSRYIDQAISAPK
ncbi:MAG: hypothetical protein DMF62_11490 [Acidobacteria bacterium]|nr:MAG: hypothetical protein DMF62_11490 [Acidobacteriota bacterium]